MAFDIYAGTFVRYYTREWENVVQRQARIDGTPYTMIYAGDDDGPPPAGEVLEAVTEWREGINAGLAKHKLGPIEWSEEASQPYFTDRPSWEGYSGLQLWAAYAERPQKSPPHALPESWADDPVWQSVADDNENIRYRAIIQANVWLPGDFEFCFPFPGLTEDEVMIASTSRLLRELRELGENPPKWSSGSFLGKLRKKEIVPLQEAAEWGHSSFSLVVEQAVQAKVPFFLSF